jgi:hypothetical protein
MTPDDAPAPGLPSLRPDLPEALRVFGATLDGIEVAMCAFDEEDRALVWNRSFLKLFPEHDGHVHEGEPYRDNLRRFYLARLDAQELPFIDNYIDGGVKKRADVQGPDGEQVASANPIALNGSGGKQAGATLPAILTRRVYKRITMATYFGTPPT